MFTEDLDSFFGDFAVDATYNSVTAVRVILDNDYIEAVTGVASVNPVAMGKGSDFADPVGKTLVIGATTYTIMNKRPIDEGAIVALELRI